MNFSASSKAVSSEVLDLVMTSLLAVKIGDNYYGFLFYLPRSVFRTSQAAKPGHASQASQAKPDRVGSGNLQARSIFPGLAC